VAIAVLAAGCGAGRSTGSDAPTAVATNRPAGAVATPAPAPTAPRHRPPRPVRSNPFAGITVGIDPGHNGRNFADPSYIDRQIWNGREHEDCNTTGTETDSGYSEARFNFAVATDLAAGVRKAGAHVVMTRTSNDGVGPCVDRRAEIINASHAAVAVDIHADGGPASGRGFTVLEPVADGPNDKVIRASRRYGADLRNAFEKTGMPTSTYDGTNGITLRDNLAGLNLTTVPQALIECGNMRNPTDAALLVSAAFQRRAATAIMAGMATFLAADRRAAS
jgi:N-acetylmuramoyl-L-alanine amidase